MAYISRQKTKRSFFPLIAVLFFGIVFFIIFGSKTSSWERGAQKPVTVIDNTTEMFFLGEGEMTTGEFLLAHGIAVNDNDAIFPSRDTKLLFGTNIIIERAKTIMVRADNTEQTLHTRMPTLEQALAEAGITLDEDDIIEPQRDALVVPEMHVSIIRVDISEETVDKPIVFSKKTNEDNTLSWRKTIVTQKGENGIERSTYRVSRYDGKEVKRRLIKTETVKQPVTEITTQGTYVKAGKSHSGVASWYAYTGTMAAANPWLPLGSYVRVTNTENGKSVIVKINDRGPFVPGRIIDLDKVAFVKIASLGAGVIHVKMEEITN